MILRAVLIWLSILFLAIANGALRELVISPSIGWHAGHVVSTILLSALILGAAWLATPWISPATSDRAWVVGAVWLALTLAFEFLAGHYLFGTSWDELIAGYDLLRGRIWIVVPIVTLVAPVWVYSVRVK